MRIYFAAALAALAVSAPARADTLTLSTSPDPAEDRPVTIYAHAVGSADQTLQTRVRRRGTEPPCGATLEADPGNNTDPQVEYGGWDVAGDVLVSGDTTFDEPGDHLVCAWLQDRYDDTAATAAASLVVHVRSNAPTVALSFPSRASARAPLPWTASVTTDVPRWAWVALRPAVAPGDTRACASSVAARAGAFTDLVDGEEMEGTQTVGGTIRAGALPAGTLYLVCAWVQEDGDDPAAEAQAAAFLQVGEPAACTRARLAVRRARAAVRRARARFVLASGRRSYEAARARLRRAAARRAAAERRRTRRCGR